MEKKRCFLGFLASLAIVFFTTTVFAAGYTCSTKKYTSCNSGHYMSGGTGAGNSCNSCPSNSTSSGGTVTSCTCKTGYSVGGTTSGATSTTTSACSAIPYTITYNLNSGRGCSNGTYNVASAAITLCTPSRDGYTFGGWYTNSALSGSAVTSIPSGSTGNKTYWAKWTAKTFKVAYANGGANSGTAPTSPTSCTYAGTCNAPNNPYSKTGYEFDGWTCTSSSGSCTKTTYAAGESISTATTVQDATITLTAKWKLAVYTITLEVTRPSPGMPVTNATPNTIFEKYNTGWYTSSAATNTIARLTSLPTVDIGYYMFKGYYTAASGGTQIIDATGAIKASNTQFKADATIYTQWESCSCEEGTGVDKCTTSISNNSCSYKATCQAGYQSPTCTGAGTTSGTCSCSPAVYTITLNDSTNGGSGGSGKVYEKYATGWSLTNFGPTVTKVAKPTKTNSIFNGYYTAASGGDQIITSAGTLPANTKFTANTTLYAQFTACASGWTVNSAGTSCIKTFTLSSNGGTVKNWFNGNLGASTHTVTCLYGQSCNFYEVGADKANKITWTNNDYVAIGGFGTTATCNSAKYSFTASEVNSMTNGATYYACKTYKVTFDLNSGSNNKPADVYATYGAAMPALSTTENPTRTGYTFGGWYNDSSMTGGTQYYTSARTSARNWDKSTAPTTLYARWTPINFSVEYDANKPSTAQSGSTVANMPSTQNCTYGSTCALSTTKPTLAGYTFKGWASTATSTTPLTTATNAVTTNSTYTVYAIWEANCNAIEFNYAANGGSGSGGNRTKLSGSKDWHGENCGKNSSGDYMTPLQLPYKVGHTFTGYFGKQSSGDKYFDASGASTPAGNNLLIYAPLTVYAQFEPNIYAVSYSCGDGQGTPPSSDTATYGATYTLKDGPDIEGAADNDNLCSYPNHAFVGWKIASENITYGAQAIIQKWSYTSNVTFVAQWEESTCSNGQYHNGMQCLSCPSGYPFSDTNATSSDQCYKNSTKACINPGANNDCPANAGKCGYDSSGVVACKQYYGKTTCEATEKEICEYSMVSCNADYYNDNNEQCLKCTGLGEGSLLGTWDESYGGSGGPEICYNACRYQCVESNICSRLLETDSTVEGCEYAGATINGGKYYDTDICSPRGSLSCSATFTCAAGYKSNVDGNKVSVKNNQLQDGTTYCVPQTYTITLDRQSGTGGPAAVYQKYSVGYSLSYTNFDGSALITSATMPTRKDYVFEGFYTKPNGEGDKVIDVNGVLPANTKFTADTTLYAHWRLDVYHCVDGKGAGSNNDNTAMCASGSYCPGGDVPAGQQHDPQIGCQRACPADAEGGTLSSELGSSEIGACTTTRRGPLISEGHGTGEQVCQYNKDDTAYNNSCNTTIVACDAGYWRPMISSTVCMAVDFGNFSPATPEADSINRTACSTLAGADVTVTTASQTSGVATDCYNECPDKDIANGTLKPANAKPHYDGARIPACDYNTTPICDSGYEASGATCVPKVYEITLSDNGGRGGSGKAYLKYATGWFSNKAATTPLTKVNIPTKTDSDKFGGYEYNGTTVIGSDGVPLTTSAVLTFTTEPLTVTAIWDARTPIKCNAGTYYSQSQSKCVQCTSGSYCEGVETFIGVSEDKGIKSCDSLNGTYTQATGAGAVAISSAAGAQAATDCYATNVAYESATKYGAGSQTCYYRGGAYTDKCKDIQILSCAGGYWRESNNATDCVEAGRGYYSADGAITRTACPGKASNSEVTSDTATSTDVQHCFLGNIWLEPGAVGGAAHGGVRRSCHHKAAIDNANSTAGYTENCPVTEVVTCNAGYYLENKEDTDCTAVGDGYYSPAQSYFSNEPLQPTIENKTDAYDPKKDFVISSLLRSQCASGSQTGTETAATAQWCCVTSKDVLSNSGEKVGKATWNGNPYNVSGNTCLYTVACNEGYRATGLTNGVTANPRCVWDDPDTCPEGFYCPAGSEEPIECPADDSGKIGTTDTGAKLITECYIAYDNYSKFKNGTGSAICNYSDTSKKYTTCHDIRVKTCFDGYYYSTAGAALCDAVPNGEYSPAPDTGKTACPAGGSGSNSLDPSNTDRGAKNWNECYKNCVYTDENDTEYCIIDVAHSTSCSAPVTKTVYATSASEYPSCQFVVTCQTGYTAKANNTEAPTCDANKYTVTLDKNGGVGNVADSVQCTFDSGACALPAVSGLTKSGYTAEAKWCTEENGGGTCYNAGTSVTSNISPNGTDIRLYAVWTPNVYKITLRHADASVAGAPTVAYLKYATGWFTAADAIVPLEGLSTLPEKVGYEFAGYKAANGVTIITTEGKFQRTQDALTFTTADTDITVVWSAGNTTCGRGMYYAGTGTTCNLCEAGFYCPGGSFPTDAGQAGKNACRDGGTTVASTAEAPVYAETQCYKDALPTYVASHGKGTQTCYFDVDALTYSAGCVNKFITSCDAGYWQANKAPNQESPDCDAVGEGYYSGDADITRTQCPSNGTTAGATADSIQQCFKTELDYQATFGSGTQRCYYSDGTGDAAIYNRGCDNRVILKCRGGYWLDATVTEIDCTPVGTDYYSTADDIARHECEDGGHTSTETASDPHLCYKGDEVYTADHGGGFRTCFYTSGTGANALYETSCETPTLTYCIGGYYANTSKNSDDCVEVGYGFWSPAAKTEQQKPESLLRQQCAAGETTATATSESASACYSCPAGTICDPNSGEQPKTCAMLTNGKYTLADSGATDVKQCYRECDKGAHVATMTGRDYFGGTNTCKVATCQAGYHLENGQCVECPAGMFCDAGGGEDCPAGEVCDNTPKSCADLGDGSWKYSDAAATGPRSCYRKCEAYPIDGGTAVPVSERAYYDNNCEFKGRDEEGNPCDIENGVCVVKSCKSSYEMIGGRCVPCNRENALTYKDEGNCQVATCRAGFHPYGQKCEGDIAECEAPNALRAEMSWNNKTNSFGICTIKECEDGFHISSNACVADVQVCTVEHGRGEKEWNHTTNTWGECIATYCDPGYTNDPSESNEPTKQCGNCSNKFGVGGEIAVSTYSRGCTIGTCMYQGEMYNLENNECKPICSVEGYSDETGTMKWNPRTKKCERTCFDGYTMW